MALYSDWMSGRPRTKILIIVVIALLMRLPGLFLPSLTGDEISTVNQARVEFGTMLNRLAYVDIPGADIAPPFYYFILHAFLRVFSFVPWATRSLSLLFDLATVMCVFLIGRQLFTDRIALIASFFIALSPFHIWYATEIRMYALVALLSTLSTLFFLYYSSVPDRKYLYYYWIFSTFGLYTQYYFSLLLIGHLFAAFILFDRRRIKGLILALVGVGLAFLPWLGPLLNDLKVLSSYVPLEGGNPMVVPAYLVLKLVFFGNRFFLFAHMWLYLVGAGLLAVLVMLYLKNWRRFSRAVHSIFLAFACVLVLILVSSFISHQAFRPHAAIVFLPLVLILLAFWIENLFRPAVAQAFRIVFILVWGFVTIQYNQEPLYGKARVKEAMSFLKVFNQSEIPLFNPPLKIPCPHTVRPGSFQVFEYYAHEQFPVHFLTGADVAELDSNLHLVLGSSREFFLVTYEDMHPPAFIRELKTLIEGDFRPVFSTRFESLVDTFPLSITYYRRE